MKNFLIIVLSLIWVSTQAQTKLISIDKYTTNYTFTPLPEETKEVKTNTKPSPKLDSKAEVNAKLDSVNQLNANIKYALGYRIQVYAGASSVEVKKIKEALSPNLLGFGNAANLHGVFPFKNFVKKLSYNI